MRRDGENPRVTDAAHRFGEGDHVGVAVTTAVGDVILMRTRSPSVTQAWRIVLAPEQMSLKDALLAVTLDVWRVDLVAGSRRLRQSGDMSRSDGRQRKRFGEAIEISSFVARAYAGPRRLGRADR